MRKELMIFLFTIVALIAQSFYPQPVETSTQKVVAASGDTVWEIAERLYDEKETRCFSEFVDDIRKDNNLMGGNVLQAGQELTVRIIKKK